MQKYYDFMHHHYILTQINVYSYEKVSFYHSFTLFIFILLSHKIQFSNSLHIHNLLTNQDQKPIVTGDRFLSDTSLTHLWT